MEQKENPIAELMEEEQAGWIVTFADLMTLLLVFFVLLYSVSSLDLEKFKKAISSIQVSLGEEEPSIRLLDITGGVGSPDKKISLEEITGLRPRKQRIMKEINKFIEQKKLGEHVNVKIYKGKVITQIMGKALFESGSAEFVSEGKPILDEIIEVIKRFPEYDINIKGHTDDVPISTERFPSNWELSAIRATTVLKYLIQEEVDPARLTATGYGELLPLVPNDTPENRARNRRVEFVLEKKKE